MGQLLFPARLLSPKQNGVTCAVSVSEHVVEHSLSQSQRLHGVVESYGKETDAKQAYRLDTYHFICACLDKHVSST